MDFVSSIVDLGILIFATIIGSLGTMISSQNQSGNDSIRDEVFFPNDGKTNDFQATKLARKWTKSSAT